MQLKTTTCALLLAGIAGTAAADHISNLADLIANDGSVTVGDKLFDNFGYAWTGDMPDASGVNVIEFTDIDGNFGLRFQGSFIDLAGGGGSDALITFDVTVLNPNNLISGANLAGNPDVLGATPGNSFASVTETFLPGNTTDAIAIYANVNESNFADSVIFDQPVATLSVQKDINLFADDNAVASTISFIDQSFPQVPEPGSLALLGLGGLALLRRRR